MPHSSLFFHSVAREIISKILGMPLRCPQSNVETLSIALKDSNLAPGANLAPRFISHEPFPAPATTKAGHLEHSLSPPPAVENGEELRLWRETAWDGGPPWQWCLRHGGQVTELLPP